MDTYKRIKELLIEGSLGAGRIRRVVFSKKSSPDTVNQKIGAKNAKRMLRGLKNTGNVEDKDKSLGVGKPEIFQRAVKAGQRTLPKPFKNK